MDCELDTIKCVNPAIRTCEVPSPVPDFLQSVSGMPQFLLPVADKIFVPLSARRLPQARVVWLNKAWFAERGIPTSSDSNLGLIEAWLLNSFAFAQGDQDAVGTLALEKVLYADRYGATGIAAHGGAGRAAVCGDYYVKGVGATPLVGRADWHHSHGMMWLEEALREAIFSEVLRHELPFGAVPAIAVIATGIQYVDTPDNRPRERALLVRPFRLRPSHFQRALGFRPERLSHLADVDRVASIFAWASSKTNLQSRLEKFARRSMAQASALRIMKIFHGGFCTSNISISGEILDFGSASSFKSYEQGAFEIMGQAIGDEVLSLRAGLQSLDFYGSKYTGKSLGRSMRANLEREYVTSTIRFMREFAGTNGECYADEATRSVLKRVCGISRASKQSDADISINKFPCEPLDPIWKQGCISARRIDWVTSHRNSLDRTTLQELLDDHLRRARPDAPSRSLADVVDRVISKARRWHRALPPDFVPDSAAVNGTCFVVAGVLGSLGGRRERHIWIQAPVVEGLVHLDGEAMEVTELASLGSVRSTSHLLHVLVPEQQWVSLPGVLLENLSEKTT